MRNLNAYLDIKVKPTVPQPQGVSFIGVAKTSLEFCGAVIAQNPDKSYAMDEKGCNTVRFYPQRTVPQMKSALRFGLGEIERSGVLSIVSAKVFPKNAEIPISRLKAAINQE